MDPTLTLLRYVVGGVFSLVTAACTWLLHAWDQRFTRLERTQAKQGERIAVLEGEERIRGPRPL